MRRIISLLLPGLLVCSSLWGCNKMPSVDKSVKPEMCFSQYKTLTNLYFTPWRDVLKALNVDLQEVDTEGLNHVGIPMEEVYACVTFDVALRFGGEDNYLTGVEYAATYSYPEDEEKLLRDIVNVSRSLISEFGAPSDSSIVFNWVDAKLGEQWNRDIPFWQDTQVLKRLLDEGYEGTLVYWNLTGVAPDNIKNTGAAHGVSVGISVHEEEQIAVLTIGY